MSDFPELAQSTGGLEKGAYIDGPTKDSLQQSLDDCVSLTLAIYASNNEHLNDKSKIWQNNSNIWENGYVHIFM